MFASKDIFLKSSGGYTISRSVRLRSSASAYFNRTPASAGNQQIFSFSFWIKRGLLNNTSRIFSASNLSTSDFTVEFTGDTIEIFGVSGGVANLDLVTTAVYRDPSAWYHIVVAFDTTQATAANRAKLYVNGLQVTSFTTATYPAQNANLYWNTATDSRIGIYNNGTQSKFDGYLTEINFIDGQALTPSSFGQTNTVTGVWQPIKYTGTYGTNGFYLNFSDNSSNTATTIGKDYSGNGNNWTPNNISVTAGVTYDSFLDVPTPYADGGTGRGNYSVGNPLAVNLTTNSSATLTNGNLYINNGSANYSGFSSTIGIPTSGKWAWKFKVTGSVGASNDGTIGFACNSAGNPVTGATNAAAANWYTTVQIQYISGRGVVHNYAGAGVVTDLAQTTGATNDEYEFLIDRDAGTTIVKCNGTTLVTVTGLPTTQVLFPYGSFYQTGGYFIFDYTPSDTTYKTLNTQNLPTPTISNGANYMAATLWTGNGTSQSIVNTVNGVSFQPDFVWNKSRSTTYSNEVTDSVRGTTQQLYTNLTDAEYTASNQLTSFNSNGFTIGAGNNINASGQTYVGWQWKAGGTAVSNTAGSITSTVSVGATQGFSVVTYTGTGANATVGHGLGVAPNMVIVKQRSGVNDWYVYTSMTGATNYLQLNTTVASSPSATAAWNGTSPTSTVFSLGNGAGPNTNGGTYVAYCFAAVKGYSAFGSYTGNGSADGPFVYLGFRPKFIMLKRTDAVGNWNVYDSTRSTYNASTYVLYPNLSNAEDASTDHFDWLSNGFKMRSTNQNTSSGTFIYMAFAQNPFSKSLAV